jgi:hypothetical protein
MSTSIAAISGYQGALGVFGLVEKFNKYVGVYHNWQWPPGTGWMPKEFILAEFKPTGVGFGGTYRK